jgi:hypothetical protein
MSEEERNRLKQYYGTAKRLRFASVSTSTFIFEGTRLALAALRSKLKAYGSLTLWLDHNRAYCVNIFRCAKDKEIWRNNV